MSIGINVAETLEAVVLLELDQVWCREAGRYGTGEIRVAMGDWKWY
jgi:hypothetical protein